MARLNTESVVTLIVNGERAKVTTTELEASFRALKKVKKELREEDDPARYQKIVEQMGALKRAINEVREEEMRAAEVQKGFFGEIKSSLKEITNIASGVSIGNLIADGVKTGFAAIKGVIVAGVEAYKTFERYNTIIATALGDKSEAKKAMAELQKFAADTPYELDELTASFISLVNRGMKPTMLEMTKMGDLASSQGKSFNQLTEAILDAVTGEFERLKEFGIRASKNGDVVKLSFKGVTHEVKNTEEAIKSAILSFGAMDGVTGGMEKLSKTMTGMASNMSDNYNRVLTNIGRATSGFVFNTMKIFNFLLEKMADTRTESEKLTDTYTQQAEKVKGLEKNIQPLLGRYEELTSKSSRNKTEQAELKSIINQLANTIPGAVAQWDRLGNAININTEKAREYINVQKALLKLQNQEAIDAQRASRDTKLKIYNSYADQLQSGKVTEYSEGNLGTQMRVKRDMTPEEITALREKMRELANDIRAHNTTISGLFGNYLDGIEKTAAATEKEVTDIHLMTVKQLEDRVKKLKQQQDDTVKGSAEYKRIALELAEIDHILNPEKYAKKFDQQLSKYSQDLENMRSEYLQLAEAAKKGTVDDLDAQLAVIDNKFAKLVDKLQKLAKNPNATKGDKKLLEGMIGDITGKGGFQDQAKDTATTDARQKQDQADSDTIASAYHDLETGINNRFDKEGIKLQDGETAAMKLANTEDERLAVKAEYQTKELDLQLMHYQALLSMQKMFGGDTTAMDKQISAQKKAIGENDLANKKLTVDKQNELEQKRYQFATQVVNGLAQLIEFSMGNSKMGIVFARMIAVAQMAIDTASAISSVTAQNAKTSLTPIDYAIKVGAAIVTIFASMAKASAALKQADNIPEPGTTKKARKGALLRGTIPDGASHEEDGIALIERRTGRELGEMEGGEPLLVLSRETYRNNGRLVNELLFNSQYRNGAPVRINTEMATRTTDYYRAGGVIGGPMGADAGRAGTASGTDTGTDMAETNELLRNMAAAFEAWKEKPWSFPMRAHQETLDRLDMINNRSTM